MIGSYWYISVDKDKGILCNRKGVSVSSQLVSFPSWLWKNSSSPAYCSVLGSCSKILSTEWNWGISAMVDAYLRLLVDIPPPPSRKPSRSDTLLEPTSTGLRSTKGLWHMRRNWWIIGRKSRIVVANLFTIRSPSRRNMPFIFPLIHQVHTRGETPDTLFPLLNFKHR